MNRVLVVLDIDSTLINEEGLDLLAEWAGSDIASAVSAITDQAMAGKIDFADSLVKRVALLEGQPVSLLHEVSEALTLTEGATALIDAVHQAGGIVGAVSGGFHELVDPLASRIGLDHWLANRFEVANGVLTGRVSGEIVDAQAKASFLTRWADHYEIPRVHTIAVGDGANDVLMFGAAGVAVSFCGKPVANDQATVCIEQRDLLRVLDYVPAGT
jgi:phosphoserine phosphatase